MANWVTVRPSVPESITALADALDSILDALIAILSVVKAVLDIVKTFIVGLLDPIAAIVEAVISEIEAFLNDIRQIGLYVSFDEVESPYDHLLGGYGAFERRMIARLVDRTDPTRPDFTERTAVLAVFLYASFDTTTVVQAVEVVDRIKALFGVRRKSRTYTVPVGLEVAYGTSATGLGLFRPLDEVLDAGDPTVANLRWRMAPPPNAGAVSWPTASPPGFVVEVSTVPDGLLLGYMSPIKDSGLFDGQQDRVMGLVTDPDGRPFRLYGGADLLREGSDLAWSGDNPFTPPDVSGGEAQNGKTRLYAFRSSADQVGIPLRALVVDGKPILQRSFFVDVRSLLGVNLASPGRAFSTLLSYEDMPYEATFEDAGDGRVRVVPSDEPARTVYVRVSAVTEGFDGTFGWSIDQATITAGIETGQVRLGYAPGAFGGMKSDPSPPLTVTFPSTRTAAYLDAVATALAVMVLARADLVPFEAEDAALEADVGGTATGLEDLGRYLVPLVAGSNPSRFWRAGLDPLNFRKRLLASCRSAANAILARTGPMPASVEAYVVENSEVDTPGGRKSLAEVLWSDLDPELGPELTVLESLDTSTEAGADESEGVGPNPEVGVLGTLIDYGRVTLVREPGFQPGPDGGNSVGQGSADYSPVLYRVGGEADVRFARNVFLENPSVLQASALVLGIASAPFTMARRQDGAWVAYRLFPQGIPPLDLFLNEIVSFLRSIQAGIGAITEIILAYIEFIEARILELEALIRRIQALLDAILQIEVPAVSGLVVAAEGTAGVLEALVTSESKPQDAATTFGYVTTGGKTLQAGAYGAGVVLLAGGLPTAALEILQLFFPEEG